LEINPYLPEMEQCEHLIAYCAQYLPKTEADLEIQEIVKKVENKDDRDEREKKLREAIARGAITEAQEKKSETAEQKNKRRSKKKEVNPIVSETKNDLHLDFAIVTKFAKL